ncbi:MAG: hypothetical protein OEU56_20925, partial [Rhodospirillales bacterium]|nr:hypothetical protein [Rhodospirillales bacterium]
AARERDGARSAAAGLAGEVWDAGGTGIEARIQAAQFVSAHAAAMDWQAEANRRDLPPHARATAQRLARQLMALTTAQLGGLCRLRAEQRKDREQAMRLNEQTARLAAQETTARFKTGAADMRAMIAGFERTGRELARADREALAALAADPAADLEVDEYAADYADPAANDSAADTVADHADDPNAPTAGPPRTARPEPVGAGVPEPPPEPAPPLNRQQRRALARLRRKGRRRAEAG